MYLGSFGIDDYVGIPAATHRFSSGAAYAPTALTYSIYEEATTTGIDEDVDMTVASPFDSITGCYWVRRQLTAAAGFEAGKNYLVVVKATVDSVAAIQLHTFQVAAKVDARYVGGTAQTGRDLGASVLLSVGTGTGQVNLSSGKVPATLAAADVTGNVATDLQTIKTQTVTCAAGVTVLANVGAAGAPGANNGLPTTNGTKLNQTVDLTAGQSVACSDKTGFSLSTAGIQAIWDALTSALTTVGSIGKKLADWTIGTTQTADVNTLITTVGVAGAGLTALGDTRLANLDATVSSRNATTPPTVTAIRQEMDANSTKLANLDATVGSRSTLAAGAAMTLTAAYDAAKTAAQAGDAMALTVAERNAVADAHLDRADAIETGVTPRQAHRLEVAVAAGQTSGMATSTPLLKNPAGTKIRVTATADADGNRTAITLTDLT